MREADTAHKVTMVTANGANCMFSRTDVELICNTLLDNPNKPHTLVILEQEASYGRPLGKQIETRLAAEPNADFTALRAKKATFTTALGAISYTVLSTEPCEVVDTIDRLERGGLKMLRQKGCFGADLMIGSGDNAVRLQIASTHLESKKDAAKLREVQSFFRSITGYADDRFIDLSELKSLARDAVALVGDFNYRDILGEDNQAISPISRAPSSPAQHLFMQGLTPRMPTENTYLGDFGDQATALETDQRQVGGTDQFYLKQGSLDGFASLISECDTPQVLDTHSSDHKVVISSMVITAAEDAFTRTKTWVAHLLRDVANTDVINNIENLQNTSEDQNYLVSAFNYYMRVKSVQLDCEYYRLQGKEAAVTYTPANTETNTAPTSLGKQLADAGNDYFANKANFGKQRSYNTFQSTVNQRIQYAQQQCPTLKRTFWTGVVEWFNYFFCGADKIQTSATKIDRVTDIVNKHYSPMLFGCRRNPEYKSDPITPESNLNLSAG